MPDRFSELTAFVLVGGASRRMGRPKHELMLEGETLLARVVRVARAVAGKVLLLGPADRNGGLDVPAMADEMPGRGPLAALYTGLLHTPTEFNLILSCDLPFLKPRLLRYLMRTALECGADVTLPVTPDGYQPLAAIYRRGVRHAARRSLLNSRNKIKSCFSGISVRAVAWPELARAGFRRSTFDNLNTMEDYRRALRRLAAAASHRPEAGKGTASADG